MKFIETRIESGDIVPLTKDVLDQEVAGLYEDLLNWDCGHPLEKVADAVVMKQPSL